MSLLNVCRALRELGHTLGWLMASISYTAVKVSNNVTLEPAGSRSRCLLLEAVHPHRLVFLKKPHETSYLAGVGVVHRVHVNDLVHGAGQDYVGLLLPVLQVFLRATCGAALPQSHEQPRDEQRCPAGPGGALGTHEHRTDGTQKVNFF